MQHEVYDWAAALRRVKDAQSALEAAEDNDDCAAYMDAELEIIDAQEAIERMRADELEEEDAEITDGLLSAELVGFFTDNGHRRAHEAWILATRGKETIMREYREAGHRYPDEVEMAYDDIIQPAYASVCEILKIEQGRG
ncbi:MAG: hypothetical protein GTO22_14465 [Gemmatimonadales bacterium]|nr:hypothetical protein [Gemmatimonadales bacterium]